MRRVIALLALLGLAMAGNLATPALAAANSGYAGALTSPFWIASGIVALVLVIVIVALAARDLGTTVIRD